MLTLQNNVLKLTVDEKTGQMLSLTNQFDQEMLYQRDEAWKDSNPTLFPLIGNTYTKQYLHHGQVYEMKNHGLIRYATMQTHLEGDRIVVHFTSNEQTLRQYPFAFDYELVYRLQENRVLLNYRIQNQSQESMPFAFGLHPAFKIDQLDECQIVVEPKQEVKQLVFGQGKQREQGVQLDTFGLNRALFDQYATLIYTHIKSGRVSLRQKSHTITMPLDGFSSLAIWTHEQESHFVCLEPWNGHGGFVKQETQALSAPCQPLSLAPQDVYELQSYIEVSHD